MTASRLDAPASVLIGADAPLARDAMRSALSRQPGLVVAGAIAIAQVVDAAQGNPPAVVLLYADGAMGTAVNVCAALRDRDLPVRVVMVGPAASQADLVAAIEAGVDGYVATDDRIDGLLSAVERAERGEASIPPGMLGTLLRSLIRRRREEDAVLGRFSRLSEREREVLPCLAEGLDHRSIALRLNLSPHTARTHAQNILRKLEVHSRVELVTLVMDYNLVERFGLQGSDGPSRGDRDG